MRKILSSIIVLTLLGSFSPASRGEDWPMWRYDTRRSGVSPEKLSDRLQLRWTHQLPPPKTAWPNEKRLQFDASYLPVVMGKTLFVGSMIDGGLTAYDTETGKIRWRRYTDGPIRVAPVAWKGHVYVGSDDGHLYCFDAASGEEKWRVRGAPSERKNYFHLGNSHLVSYWPVRGGPVIEDGVVFFGAGIWPSMGVFLMAVDARTGEVRWSNRKINYLDQIRIDHNELHEAGLSPQGHFLMADGKLLVPNGRSMPAGIDPKTGKLLFYVQGYRNGDSRVTASGSLAFVGDNGMVSTTDGREVGSRWLEAGKDAPPGWDGRKRDLFEGPMYGYKFLKGCDHRSALDGRLAYGAEAGVCYAYDLTQARTSLYKKDISGQEFHPARWDAPLVWKLAIPHTGSDRTTRAIIRAGDRLYSHVGRQLFALQLSQKDEAPRLAWSKTLESAPLEILAADGKLFVALADGRICCFAPAGAAVVNHSSPVRALRVTDDATAELAERIIKHTQAKDGYAVVLGVETGRLVEALLRRTELSVIAVENDPEKVRALRDRLVASGLYGQRAQVIEGDPATLPLPPYLASLVVSERPASQWPLSKMSAKEVYRILRPYGGVACFTQSQPAELVSKLTASKLARAEIRQAGQLVSARRVGALPGAANWTHESSDAARTFYSRDELVQAPLAILWYGDGSDHGFFKNKDYGRGVKPQVAGGRLFAFNDLTQVMRAIDVYTGRLLWSRKFDTSLVRYASLPDAVYVGHGQQCEVLDAATGEPIKIMPCRLETKPKGAVGVVAVRVTDDLVLIGLGLDMPQGHSHGAIESGMWDARVLVALDRKSGEQLWTRQADQRFNLHAIAVGGGMVFCTDSMPPMKADELKRRGTAPETFESVTRAMAARTGKVIWEKSLQYSHRAMTGRGPLAIRPYDDWLCFESENGLLVMGKVSQMTAVDAKTGEVAWSEAGGMQPLILRGDTFVNQAGQQFDTLTGSRQSAAPLFQRGGCNYTVGNKNLLFLRNKCATYVDLNSQKEHSLRNLRSGCSNSLVAADGLLNVPCFSVGCVCNYPLQTSFSMFHMPESQTWSGEKPIVIGGE